MVAKKLPPHHADGQKLKRTPIQKGVSVGHLAKFIGISNGVSHKYERGQVSPQLDKCKLICEVLDTTLSELFDDDYVPPKNVDLKYKISPGQTIYIEADSLN